MMKCQRTALILVGGMASRANYLPKYLFQYKEKTFLDRQIGVLRTVCDEIIVSCRDEEQCHEISDLPVDIKVTDVKKQAGPVEGIRIGSAAAHGEYIFVVACDMPLISPSVIAYLFELALTAEVVIPRWNDGTLEPLHAVYRRNTLQQYFTNHSPRRLIEIAMTLDSVMVPVDDIKKYDPELQSFMNINDLEAFTALQEIPR